MEDFDREYIKSQIEDLYGSLANFAEVTGVTPQTVNGKLNKPSNKFIRQLKTHGIMVNKAQVGNNNRYESNDRIVKVLERLVKSQESTIDSIRRTMELQQQSLLEKNRIVENLQKENDQLRKENERLRK